MYGEFKKLAKLEESQVQGCFLTWEMYKSVIHDTELGIFNKAALGGNAPIVDLYRIERNTKQMVEVPETTASEDKTCAPPRYGFKRPDEILSLKCLMRPGVPLVLNFGSCS